MEPGKDHSRIRTLAWATGKADLGMLRRKGYHILHFGRISASVRKLSSAHSSRRGLANPAAPLLRVFRNHPRVAVLDVRCATVEDLEVLLGYVLEPAFRAGCSLRVHADQGIEELDPAAFIAPGWRCPWTLERLRHLAAVYAEPVPIAADPPPSRWRRLLGRLSPHRDAPALLVPRLDPEQNAAVAAGDGVVQIIAPAGSGKTTVLVERVRELHRRGTPCGRILCSTFNRDACREMAARLKAQGLEGVQVRSFHGLGLWILKEEGRLRDRIGTVEDAVWEEIAREAAACEPGCGAFNGAAAQDAVGMFKLADMIGPGEAWSRAAAAGPRGRAEVRAFALYEEHLRRTGMLDFDDLIARSVALLQTDGRVRAKWQARFERVLVDEYQDIEPAQALLIGLLAAPQDSLFCVGDEDQCIYAWRRASVQRVIDLDRTYPGLERFPLVRNYRCGRRITLASRRLIRHNRQRFDKPLHPGIPEPGAIVLHRTADLHEGAHLVARLLGDARPGSAAVLARSGSLLAMVAAAGLPEGIEPATVHGSKGREWDRVILFGADEGRFPLARAVRAGVMGNGGGGLEDERRLFYVALTRARLRLDVVCSRDRPSRFIGEAGLRRAFGR